MRIIIDIVPTPVRVSPFHDLVDAIPTLLEAWEQMFPRASMPPASMPPALRWRCSCGFGSVGGATAKEMSAHESGLKPSDVATHDISLCHDDV